MDKSRAAKTYSLCRFLSPISVKWFYVLNRVLHMTKDLFAEITRSQKGSMYIYATLFQKPIFCPKIHSSRFLTWKIHLLGWLTFYRLGWVEFLQASKIQSSFWPKKGYRSGIVLGNVIDSNYIWHLNELWHLLRIEIRSFLSFLK